MISREEVRKALTGPVASLSVTFERDGAIDFPGIENLIDKVIDGGSGAVILTYGDSLYSILTDQEVAEVTAAVVEHTAGRAMVVAADRQWWTGKTVEFARYSQEIGADVLMVRPPNWGGSCTEDTLVEHYAAVAKHIPVMVVTGLFSGEQELGLRVLERLRDEVDGIVALKEDAGPLFARKMCLLVHQDWAVFAGGQKQTHMNMVPYGCDGYMSTFIQFRPEVAHDYWHAVQRQDWDKARQVIRDHDMPYFEFVRPLPGSFDAAIHGVLELYGVAKRWRRKPYHSLTDEEMERLSDFFRSRGWL